MSYVGVILEISKKKLVIPTKWLYIIDNEFYDDGVNQEKTYKIFYSREENTTPNFSSPLETEFSENLPACYNARIFRFFGKYFQTI